jgi:hypothetical protein
LRIKPPPRLWRRFTGMVLALAVSSAAGFAVWASTSDPQAETVSILVRLKLKATDSTSTSSRAADFVATSGEAVTVSIGQPYDARCVASLVSKPSASPDGMKRPAGDNPSLSKGQILLECILRNKGEVVATPALLVMDSDPATLVFVNNEHASRYIFEVLATTSKDQIPAEKRATAKQ